MAEVRLRSIEKEFSGGVHAVGSCDLDISDGEFLVLVGPSGCGKSTLLRMIAGLEEPSGGTITIGSRDVTHVDPADRDIAMVFQNYACTRTRAQRRTWPSLCDFARCPKQNENDGSRRPRRCWGSKSC